MATTPSPSIFGTGACNSRTPAPDKQEFERARFCQDPIVVVASKDQPLAFRRTFAWTDLRDMHWILAPVVTALEKGLTQTLARHKLSLPQGCVRSTSPLVLTGLLEGIPLHTSRRERLVCNGMAQKTTCAIFVWSIFYTIHEEDWISIAGFTLPGEQLI
ncbi:LysR substrate-binding domain-containing protein [Burkholderia ubonensis]|uniref:LysR substrate-binding domain-containing protein n=1 Tax=Burkholderia ubonensis TaxID=101571 RepID=UPI0009B2ED19